MKATSIKHVFVLFGISGILMGLGSGAVIGYLMRNLPPVDLLTQYKPAVQTSVLDSDGGPIGRYYDERRIVLKRDEIPDLVIQTLLAAEDRHFYSHNGFDMAGIARAIISNIKAGGISQGGSTISQQVARLMFLTTERTFNRKIKEALLTFQIERRFSKDEIITIYLNQSCFGHGAFGIEAAARTFYNKSASQLTIPESALLMSLLKNPTKFSPIKHPERSKQSRDRVITRMVNSGFISEDEMKHFQAEPLNLNPEVQQGFIAPYFVEEIRSTLEAEFGFDSIMRGGLTVRSTLNRYHQESANKAVQSGLDAYIERHPEAAESIQAAFISMRPDSGNITAMVGGSSFKKTQFNRAVQARRQPGSAIKPFLYLCALMQGYTPSTIIMDTPYEYQDSKTKKIWKPLNYDQKFRGPVTLRQCLELSLNVPTAKLLEKIGMDRFLDTVKRAGIQSELPPFPSTVLGAGEVTLLELTNAYATIASGGLRVRPRMIQSVEDSDGRLLYEEPFQVREVLNPIPCFQLTRLLEGAVQHGTAWRAKTLKRPVAAKTGTTNDYTNAWFIGYLPELVVGAWIGFDLNQSLGTGETGSRAAGPMFTEFLQNITDQEGKMDFEVPGDVVFRLTCHETGYLATKKCPVVINEAFSEGSYPTMTCPTHPQ